MQSTREPSFPHQSEIGTDSCGGQIGELVQESRFVFAWRMKRFGRYGIGAVGLWGAAASTIEQTQRYSVNIVAVDDASFREYPNVGVLNILTTKKRIH